MDLSAIKFDVYGREWFGKYYPHYIFDFENGSYDRIQDVLYRFVQTTRPLSIEASAFDGKDKDATTLDGYAFTDIHSIVQLLKLFHKERKKNERYK